MQLQNKINNLELQIRQIGSNVIHKKDQNVDNQSTYVQKSALNIQNNMAPIQNMTKVQVGEGVKGWPKIVSQLKQEGKIMLYTNLMNSTANEINDMTVGISFSKGLTPIGKTILEKSENIAELEKRVSAEFGKPMRIKYINQTKEIVVPKEESKIESLAQDLDLPFNIIE